MKNLLKRYEAENLSIEETRKIALAEIEYQGFVAIIFECMNTAYKEMNCNIFYGDKKINHITYPDYVVNIKDDLNAYKKYVKKQLKVKTYSVKQLKSIKNYQDFSNKLDFVFNIMPQLFDGVSIFNMKPGDDRKYPYKAVLTHRFKNQYDANYVQGMHDHLHKLYKEMMKDPAKFREAVLHEFYNHETPIDWDGMTPALNALGINYNKLSDDFKALVNDAYRECCNSHAW